MRSGNPAGPLLRYRLTVWCLAGGAVLWVVLLVAAPTWKGAAWPAARAAAALVFEAGARLCHQQQTRSVSIGGHSLPVCGRCTGLYLGGAFGLLVVAALGRSSLAARRNRRLLLTAAIPTLLTLWVERAWRADPGTLVRALSAVPLGGAAGWLIGAALMDPTARAQPRPENDEEHANDTADRSAAGAGERHGRSR
jgi:hypothetical protein